MDTLSHSLNFISLGIRDFNGKLLDDGFMVNNGDEKRQKKTRLFYGHHNFDSVQAV